MPVLGRMFRARSAVPSSCAGAVPSSGGRVSRPRTAEGVSASLTEGCGRARRRRPPGRQSACIPFPTLERWPPSRSRAEADPARPVLGRRPGREPGGSRHALDRPAARSCGVDHTMLIKFSGFAIKLLCVLGIPGVINLPRCTWSSACPRSCPQHDRLRQRREGELAPLGPRLLAVAVVSRRWA